MNKRQILGISGIILLIIGGISPIAKLNGAVISFFPIWDNFTLNDGLWNWRDISFFAVTGIILIFLSIWFLIKKKYAGLIVTGLLWLFISIIILFLTLDLKFKYEGFSEIAFNISWAWFVIFTGTLFMLITGILKPKY